MLTMPQLQRTVSETSLYFCGSSTLQFAMKEKARYEGRMKKKKKKKEWKREAEGEWWK